MSSYLQINLLPINTYYPLLCFFFFQKHNNIPLKVNNLQSSASFFRLIVIMPLGNKDIETFFKNNSYNVFYV